jgi:RsiW-degrading membrane proteinase PrsW (M82 family)
MVPLQAVALVVSPFSLLLALVPLAIVLPCLAWLDRVEPEPRGARLHALLWGGTVAALVSSIVNSAVAVGAGETAAAVVSAPLVEELTKGLGVWWAVRRHELDGVTDGLVYAGWVAAGFAAVENVQYFLVAADDGSLAETFVLRGLLTPFAHPLFTAWTGVAIGWAVARGRPAARGALPGLAVAIAMHAAWNGSLTAAALTGRVGIALLAALVFVAVFVGTVSMVVRLRQQERRQFLTVVPYLAARCGIAPETAAAFADWPTMKRRRAGLSRAERRRFDDLHAVLARLAVLHCRPGGVDAVTEARILERLGSRGPDAR